MALAVARLADRDLGPAVGRVAVAVLVLCSTVALGVASTVVAPVLLFAATAALVLVVLAVRWPRAVVLTTLLALPFLGVVRRATGSYASAVDPLALVGPFLAAACLLVLAQQRSERHRTPLTRAVTAMVIVGVLELANPLQGGPTVAVLGAGLFIGPMVWFYVGQRVGDAATLAFVSRALAVIAVLAAAYGTKQLLLGFAPFELRWIAARLSTYAALDISGQIRPFSTFASSAEYSYILVLGAVLLAVRRPRPGLPLRALGSVALLVACFYAGTRSIFVTGVLAVVTAVLVHRIRHLGRALAVCGIVGVVALALLQFVPLATDDSGVGRIRNRTLVGLARPFDREVSTLGLHLDGFGRGVTAGLRAPLGRGAGAVNLAGAKLNRESVSGEHDVPNVLLAYGWAGGIILVVLLTRIYQLVRACVLERRHELLGPALFVLALFGVWFAGELYAASALVWFFAGSLDRLIDERRASGGPETTVLTGTSTG